MMRLKDNHPDLIKLQEFFQYMEDNNISFDLPPSPYSPLVAIDGHEYTLNDLEQDHMVDSLPPGLEWKLNYEK